MTGRWLGRRPGWRLAGVCLWVLVCAPASAQVPQGPMRGFVVPVLEEGTLKLKARIRGEVAQPVGPDLVELTGLRLEQLVGDRTNLVITANQCLLHTKERVLRSSGALRLDAEEGDLSLEGKGFGWSASAGLTISNQVSALVRKEAAGSGTVRGTNDWLRIRSDRFRYLEGLGEFEGRVLAEDPQGTLECGRLRLQLAEGADPMRSDAPRLGAGQSLQTLEADQTVRVTTPGLVAGSDRARYDVRGETISLDGRAHWEAGDREGSAESMLLNRRTQALRAERAVRVRWPATALLSGEGWLAEGGAKASPHAAGVSRLEITAETLAVEPEGVDEADHTAAAGRRMTARFEGGVRVAREETTLDCRRLTMTYLEQTGPGAPPRDAATPVGLGGTLQPLLAVADEAVELRQATNRVNGTRAVFDAAPGTITIAGPVTWLLGNRRGESRELILVPAERMTRARGAVRLRLPPESLAALGRLGMRDVTSQRGTAGAAGPPVEIACEEFEHRAGATPGAGGELQLRGGVRVTAGEGMTLRCREAQGRLAAAGDSVETLTAAEAVELRLVQGETERTARGAKAVYTAAEPQIELFGDPEVELTFREAEGTTTAVGPRAVYRMGPDALALAGPATVTSPRGAFEGASVELDRGRGRVSASGLWKMTLPTRQLPVTLPEVLTTP